MKLHYGGKSPALMISPPAGSRDSTDLGARDRRPLDTPNGRSSLLGMLAEKLIQGRNNQRRLKAQENQFDQTGIIPS